MESKDLAPQPEAEPKENRGGPRPGSGAKPSWFREEARKALAGLPPYAKNKIKFLSDIAEGEERDTRAGKDELGEYPPVAIRDRLKAVEMLGKWAALEVVKLEGGGDDGAPISINPFANITSKDDLMTLEGILKRARTGSTTSSDSQG